jgi:hypothetical protein
VAHDDARRIALNRGGSVHVGSQLLALARNPHVLDHGGNVRAEIVTHQGQFEPFAPKAHSHVYSWFDTR